jgi:hypothetical protein
VVQKLKNFAPPKSLSTTAQGRLLFNWRAPAAPKAPPKLTVDDIEAPKTPKGAPGCLIASADSDHLQIERRGENEAGCVIHLFFCTPARCKIA